MRARTAKIASVWEYEAMVGHSPTPLSELRNGEGHGQRSGPLEQRVVEAVMAFVGQ